DYALKDPERAKEALDAAEKLAPQDLNIRGIVLNHEMNYGQPEKVVARLEEMLKTQGDNPEYPRLLAVACLRTAITIMEKNGSAKPDAAALSYINRAGEVCRAAMNKWATKPEARPFYGL